MVMPQKQGGHGKDFGRVTSYFSLSIVRTLLYAIDCVYCKGSLMVSLLDGKFLSIWLRYSVHPTNSHTFLANVRINAVSLTYFACKTRIDTTSSTSSVLSRPFSTPFPQINSPSQTPSTLSPQKQDASPLSSLQASSHLIISVSCFPGPDRNKGFPWWGRSQMLTSPKRENQQRMASLIGRIYRLRCG
jgi:hypothetical protein